MDAILPFLQSALALCLAHAWLPLAALVIGFLVRIAKNDVPVPVNIPARYRSIAAIALGILSGVVQAIVAGVSIPMALLQGLGAAMTAIAGHDVLIEGVRGGKEIDVVALAKSVGAKLSIGAGAVLLFLASCTPAQKAAIAPHVPEIEVAGDAADMACRTFEPQYAFICDLADTELDAQLNKLLEQGGVAPIADLSQVDKVTKVCACHDLMKARDGIAEVFDGGAR